MLSISQAALTLILDGAVRFGAMKLSAPVSGIKPAV